MDNLRHLSTSPITADVNPWVSVEIFPDEPIQLKLSARSSPLRNSGTHVTADPAFQSNHIYRTCG